MAMRSGVSHVTAALLSLVSGRVLVEYLRPWFPTVLEPLERGAAAAEVFARSQFGLQFAPGTFVPVATGLALAFVWGLFYHATRSGDRAGR